MKVIVSTAVSADGYLDDRSPDRLILSTPEDWAEVHRLRALATLFWSGPKPSGGTIPRCWSATKFFIGNESTGGFRPTRSR